MGGEAATAGDARSRSERSVDEEAGHAGAGTADAGQGGLPVEGNAGARRGGSPLSLRPADRRPPREKRRAAPRNRLRREALPAPAARPATLAGSSRRMQSKCRRGHSSRPCSVQGWQGSFRHSTTCPTPAGAKPSTGDVLPNSATTRDAARRGQVHQAAVVRHRPRAALEQRRQPRERLAAPAGARVGLHRTRQLRQRAPLRFERDDQHPRPARAHPSVQRHPVLLGPALRGVPGPRAERHQRLARPPTHPATPPPTPAPRRPGADARHLARLEPQRPQRLRVALERGRHRRRRRPARVHPARAPQPVRRRAQHDRPLPERRAPACAGCRAGPRSGRSPPARRSSRPGPRSRRASRSSCRTWAIARVEAHARRRTPPWSRTRRAPRGTPGPARAPPAAPG